jgi:hypothetical protein
MNVHAVDVHANRDALASHNHVKRLRPLPNTVRGDALTRPDHITPCRIEEDSDTVVSYDREGEAGRVPGVIRLLEAGHFKGVADVRLRINFFDELSARAVAAAQPVLDEQTENLIATLSGGVDELTDSLALDDEARSAISGLVHDFEAAAYTAVAEAGVGATLDSQGLADTIQAAFDELVGRMTGLLGAVSSGPVAPMADADTATADPNVVERLVSLGGEGIDEAIVAESPGDAVHRAAGAVSLPPIDTEDPAVTVIQNPPVIRSIEPGDVVALPGDQMNSVDGVDRVNEVPNEPMTEPAVTIDEAMADLTSVFQEALAALVEPIESATRLSDPSPPTGNGSAYDRFLAIYNDLRGLPPTIDEQV